MDFEKSSGLLSYNIETHAKILDELVPGYPRLAGEMEKTPEIAIFRRFGALNARCLLHLQHELIDMEERLKQLEYRDSVSAKGARQYYATDSNALRDSETLDDAVQLILVKQIREKLKEYNKALVYQSILHKLPRPEKFDMKDIRNFIHSPIPPGMDNPLTGTDAETWGTPSQPNIQAPDLITLKPRAKEDRFSTFISQKAGKYFLRPLRMLCRDSERRTETIKYYDSDVLKWTYVAVGALASLVPIISIIMLVNIKSLKKRLGVIAAFNVAITMCLQLFGGAKRSEVFAITAAFAAVQVVFVGQALDDGPKEVKFASDYVLNTICNCSRA